MFVLTLKSFHKKNPIPIKDIIMGSLSLEKINVNFYFIILVSRRYFVLIVTLSLKNLIYIKIKKINCYLSPKKIHLSFLC